jgi:hypothetical protein
LVTPTEDERETIRRNVANRLGMSVEGMSAAPRHNPI